MPTTDIVRLHKVNHGSLGITIPKKIVRELGLEKGIRLRASADSRGRVLIKRID